jgi:hypothetical protein
MISRIVNILTLYAAVICQPGANRLFASTSVLALCLTASVAAGDVLVVSPGQSIQAAINAAPPGSTIQVLPGVYNEILVVTNDDITLQGAGPGSTLLRPPASPRSTPCDPVEGSERASGICIIGDVDFVNSRVLRHVQHPRMTGFDIQNFSSYGILIAGAAGVTVDGNVSSKTGPTASSPSTRRPSSSCRTPPMATWRLNWSFSRNLVNSNNRSCPADRASGC